MPNALVSDVTVDGQVITQAEIAAEAQHHSAPAGKPGTAWRKAARALVVRKLLLAEADRRGIQAVPGSMGPGRRESDAEARIRALIEDCVCPEEPTEDRIRDVYESEPDRFRAPTLYKAAHILFAAAPGDSDRRRDAFRRADSAMETLKEAPERFCELARELSSCPSGRSGGDLGQITSGDTVSEFEAVLEELSPGEMTGKPVESRYGYHIIRLEDRVRGRRLPYDVVRPRIAEALEKASWTREARRFVRGLVSSAKVSGVDIESI